jgi:hypothetical protein
MTAPITIDRVPMRPTAQIHALPKIAIPVGMQAYTACQATIKARG